MLPGYNGLLIEPHAAALEAAIERLVSDPGLRARLAEKGLETVRELGIERWRERWEDLLRTYLERRDAPMDDRRPETGPGELAALRARQAELEGALARLRAEAAEKEIRERLVRFEQDVEFADLKASLESARDARLDQANAGLSSLEIRLRNLENDKRGLEAARQDLELSAPDCAISASGSSPRGTTWRGGFRRRRGPSPTVSSRSSGASCGPCFPRARGGGSSTVAFAGSSAASSGRAPRTRRPRGPSGREARRPRPGRMPPILKRRRRTSGPT